MSLGTRASQKLLSAARTITQCPYGFSISTGASDATSAALTPSERQVVEELLAAGVAALRVGLDASSSALHEGAQTVCDLPATLRVPMSERARCLPHMKHDMVAPPKDAAAANGEPEALDL